MKIKRMLKPAVDLLMTAALLLLSGYQFWGEAAHEWIGAGMTVLFVAHHLLNLSWHRNLTKGKYTPYRVVMLIVDLSVLLSMAAQAYSGVVMSRHLFADLPIEKGMALARRLHILGAYWGYLLMSLHLGLHWKLLLDALRKRFSRGAPTKGRRRAAAAVAAVISGWGLVVFIKRDFPTYLFLRSEFVFLDYDEPRLLFYLDYLALMTLLAAAGHYGLKGLRALKKTKR